MSVGLAPKVAADLNELAATQDGRLRMKRADRTWRHPRTTQSARGPNHQSACLGGVNDEPAIREGLHPEIAPPPWPFQESVHDLNANSDNMDGQSGRDRGISFQGAFDLISPWGRWRGVCRTGTRGQDCSTIHSPIRGGGILSRDDLNGPALGRIENAARHAEANLRRWDGRRLVLRSAPTAPAGPKAERQGQNHHLPDSHWSPNDYL